MADQDPWGVVSVTPSQSQPQAAQVPTPTPAPISPTQASASLASQPTQSTEDPWGVVSKAPMGPAQAIQQAAKPEPSLVQRLESAITGPGTFFGTDTSAEGDTWSNLFHNPVAFAKRIPQGVKELIDKPVVKPEAVMTDEQKQAHPILTGAAEFAGGITTPTNLGIMGITGGLGTLPGAAGKIIPRLVSAGFSGAMVESAFKEVPQFRAALAEGNEAEAERVLTHMTLDLAAAALGGQHAVSGKQANPAFPGMDGAVKDFISKGIPNAVGAVTNKVSDVASQTAESARRAVGAGQDLEKLVTDISKPTKGKAADYAQSVKAALPQLKEVFKANPNVSTPEEMVTAVQNHIDKIEDGLREKARGLQDVDGQPAEKSILDGAEDTLREELGKYFKEHEGAYKPEQVEAATEEAVNRLRQGGGEEPRDPSLFEAENLRRQLNKETAPAFGVDATPNAARDAKIVSAAVLRNMIDAKYDDLGVKDVKQWRQQEAPLIDVKDQLVKAFQKSKDMGDWSLINAATKSAGWGLIGSLIGHFPGGLAGESLGIAKDYIKDRMTNPNRLTQRAAKIANKEEGPTGAVIPGKTESQVPPAPQTNTTGKKVAKVAAIAGAAAALAGGHAVLSGKKDEDSNPADWSVVSDEKQESKEPEKDVHGLLEKYAGVNNIPLGILQAQAKQESGGNEAAVSPKGAVGVLQLMPKTAESLGVDPTDTEQNISGGTAYLGALHKRFGKWDQALAAYNWGPDKVQKAIDTYGDEWLYHTPDETQEYVHKIMRQHAKNTTSEKSITDISGQKVPGLVSSGNIDVNHRPVIWNDDGSPSTIFSATIPIGDGKWALVPTIANGRFLTPNGKIPKESDKKAMQALEDAATEQYEKSGEHLGIFNSQKSADDYAEKTHAWMPDGSSQKIYTPYYEGESNMPLSREEYETELSRRQK